MKFKFPLPEANQSIEISASISMLNQAVNPLNSGLIDRYWLVSKFTKYILTDQFFLTNSSLHAFLTEYKQASTLITHVSPPTMGIVWSRCDDRS